jgi:hypothetical protein
MDTEDNIQLGDLAISFGDETVVETDVIKPSTEATEPDTAESEIEEGAEPTKESSTEEDTTEVDVEETKGYFEFLKNNNLLLVEDDFEFDGSEEKLIEAKERTIGNYQKMALDAIMDHLPEDFRGILSYTLGGGTDYKKFLEAPKFDESTQEGQASIITSYYKEHMKWDDSKIERFIQKMDEDELAEEAADLKEKIREKQSEMIEAALEQQKYLQQKADDDRREEIKQITTSIEQAGFVEAKRKPNLKNFIFNPVRKNDGMRSEFQRVLASIQSNPNHLIQLADLLMDYNKEKGLAYERFEKKAETKLTQSLKTNLNKTIKAKVGQIKGSDEPINWAKFLGS